MAATEEQTRRGRCPEHGSVEGRRDVPRLKFPFIVYGVMRMLAQRRPYVCPSCGQPIDTAA